MTAKPSAWRKRLAESARRYRASLAVRGPAFRALIPATEVIEFWSDEGFASMTRRAKRRLLRQPRFLPTAYEQVRRLQSSTDDPILPPMSSADGVSIVIPVFNHAEVTVTCLRALVENTTPGEYEVIVVDNGSGRRTQNALQRVSGLRLIRNETNLGFVDACNQGAAAARGNYVVFLNNDTVVLPGWMERLRATLASDPQNGAVGAMLVYPDGRLQEAGGIVWSDGSAWNYGKNDNPEAPEYGYVREVDYCSGACLMIKRPLFEQLGGFDARYAPAFYEDTDLCFRIREAGGRVLYQPHSRVLHFEGATAGTDVSSGVKQYQVVNQRKFIERHRIALEAQWPFSPALIRVAADRRRGPHILVIDHMVPRHREDSGSVRMTNLLSILMDLGYRVTFVPDNLAPDEPYTSELQQRGIQVFYGPEQVIPYLERTVDLIDIAIICRAHFASKYLDTLRAPEERPFIVFDTVDLHHLREERHAELTGDSGAAIQAARTREIELSVANRSDVVWVTSDHEAAVLERAGVSAAVAIVPNIHHVRKSAPGPAGREGLLFIGGFQHPPNADAVEYFVQQILPLLLNELPLVKLRVVGSQVTPSIAALASDHVEILGFVEDVVPLFDAARLSVAPLRYGAGVKGKISQSLALGLPVVTTPVGAEGMSLSDDEHVLIGASAQEFARQVVRLYRDDSLWTRLSVSGRRHVDAQFGYDSVRQSLRLLLADAGRRPGQNRNRHQPMAVEYSSGFYDPEGDGHRQWRWMGPDGRIHLTNTMEPMELHLDAVAPPQTAGLATVRIFLDDELLDEVANARHIQRRYRVPCEGRRGRRLTLRLRTDQVFVPAEREAGSVDRRTLGLLVQELRWDRASAATGR
jgi:GT2 family glycosyltransferase/glycosyltransferase involved in cell wall biosynthesis